MAAWLDYEAQRKWTSYIPFLLILAFEQWFLFTIRLHVVVKAHTFVFFSH